VVIGAIVFRLVYTIALQLNMQAYMLKAVSSVIVVIAISTPYLQQQFPVLMRKLKLNRNGGGRRAGA